MNERPEQPPEGRLLADATERSGLSIREASRRAGISYGRWRQITSGVQHVSPGNFASVHAPARTLAKMAVVVGITPDQMETEGQRPDAAEVLRDMGRLEAGQAARQRFPDVLPAVTPEMETAIEAHLAEIRVRVELAVRNHPGQALTGRQVFPLDARSAETWDRISGLGWEQEGVIRGMAVMMAWAAQEARGERENGAAAGLGRSHHLASVQ